MIYVENVVIYTQRYMILFGYKNGWHLRGTDCQLEHVQLGVVRLALGELSLDISVQFADDVLQILMRVLERNSDIGELLQLVAVIGQSLNFTDNAFNVLIFG